VDPSDENLSAIIDQAMGKSNATGSVAADYAPCRFRHENKQYRLALYDILLEEIQKSMPRLWTISDVTGTAIRQKQVKYELCIDVVAYDPNGLSQATLLVDEYLETLRGFDGRGL